MCTMKHYIYFMFIQLIFKINSDFVKSASVNILSTSPIGPYKIVMKQLYSCNPTKNNKIQHNWYLSHRDNTTFILGNTTGDIPFDDTLSFEVKMALRDSHGRWQENSFMQKWTKACTFIKYIAGKAWPEISFGLGFNTTKCPIPANFYYAPGMDISIIKKTNVPKSFLYGTYKLNVYYTRQNEIYGCQNYILEVKRL
ncbi:unnamed protein product [Aphis gossypii]|uniref:MD-2-related lipid-recognition domain-containing protein n=1 Tax=Aphis gossypii TaxID=80765 RepID=A0A9P0NGW3_APHGO|nr:unnamed protein product [Aphis gossypii]